MSQLLHTLEQLLQRQITDRGMVIWYDPGKEYAAAVGRIELDGAIILRYEDGFFRLREQLEPWIEWIDEVGRPIADKELPPKLVVYIPRARDESCFALIEAETAGCVLEPGAAVTERNTRLAGLVERLYARIFPEKASHVARQVEEGLLTFEDVEQMSEEAQSGATGAMKLIFGQAAPVEVLLRFAASADFDPRIAEKNALGELGGLITQEVGLEIPSQGTVDELRAALRKHLLMGELALKLPEARRSVLGESLAPPDKDVHRDTIRHLCQTWRNRLDLQEAYAEAAAEVEASTDFGNLQITAEEARGAESFAFLETILLAHAGKDLLGGKPKKAAQIAAERRGTFWVRRNPELLLQWSLVETAAELLAEAGAISEALKKRKWSVSEMVDAYTSHARPWMWLDTLARRLESRYARFEFEGEAGAAPWEKIMARCRTIYLGTLDVVAVAYTKALEQEGFQSANIPSQSRIFAEHVAPLLGASKKTAYVLVDALRYEMASDLVEGLDREFAHELTPALGQLPGITPVGMASLMPGAENGLNLEKISGKLHVTISGQRITDRTSRLGWLTDRIGDGVAVAKLGYIVRIPPKKRKELGAARMLVVTSQEIDRIGEGESGEEEARIYMDEVLEKLRRGLRNLAALGFEEIVVTADHGFIFAEGFEEGLKMDPPGGETVELHPRCWIGQGGNAAEGYFRVPASSLELGGSLECAFPRSLGTFKVKGGSGAYFHGGASLQEQIIPVLQLSKKAERAGKASGLRWSLTLPKSTITNRFFSVSVALANEEMFAPEPQSVEIEVVSGKEVVGHAAMASYGYEEATREIIVEPGKPNSVTLMLSGGSAPATISIRLLDSKTEKQLALLSDIPVNLAL